MEYIYFYGQFVAGAHADDAGAAARAALVGRLVRRPLLRHLLTARAMRAETLTYGNDNVINDLAQGVNESVDRPDSRSLIGCTRRSFPPRRLMASMKTDFDGERTAFRDTHNANVYARYADAWRPDRLPKRADIDLFALPRCLPSVYIVDVRSGDGPPRFRVRLMGTGLVDHLKHECTGQFVDQVPLGGWEREWCNALLSALDTRRPVVATSRPTLPTGLRLTIEHLALPMSKDGQGIDQILGTMAFLGYAHEGEHRSAEAPASARLVIADPARWLPTGGAAQAG